MTSVDDVAVSLGRPISDPNEEAQVEQWIADAELLIRLRLGELALLDEDAVGYVVREAVIARLRNPDGYQYEAIDDYRYGLPNESRRITILDEWWDMLTPDGASSAFTIRAYGEPGFTEPDAWVSTTEHL
jgi:hypothetical protein